MPHAWLCHVCVPAQLCGKRGGAAERAIALLQAECASWTAAPTSCSSRPMKRRGDASQSLLRRCSTTFEFVMACRVSRLRESRLCLELHRLLFSTVTCLTNRTLTVHGLVPSSGRCVAGCRTTAAHSQEAASSIRRRCRSCGCCRRGGRCENRGRHEAGPGTPRRPSQASVEPSALEASRAVREQHKSA